MSNHSQNGRDSDVWKHEEILEWQYFFQTDLKEIKVQYFRSFWYTLKNSRLWMRAQKKENFRETALEYIWREEKWAALGKLTLGCIMKESFWHLLYDETCDVKNHKIAWEVGGNPWGGRLEKKAPWLRTLEKSGVGTTLSLRSNKLPVNMFMTHFAVCPVSS